MTADLLEKGTSITNSRMIQLEVKARYQVKLSIADIKKFMKKDLGLSYRKVKKVAVQANSERCLVLRQQYAVTMLPLLTKGVRVINVDETWLNESNFTRRCWLPKSSPGTETLRTITPTLSMIAALDTEGRVYFALSHATTDQDTFMLFLRHLTAQLDLDTPGWQEDSVLLIDNAAYHTGEEIRQYMHKMQLPMMYSAPYSYDAAPIETLFSHLKLGDLNPAKEPTGKR